MPVSFLCCSLRELTVIQKEPEEKELLEIIKLAMRQPNKRLGRCVSRSLLTPKSGNVELKLNALRLYQNKIFIYWQVT